MIAVISVALLALAQPKPHAIGVDCVVSAISAPDRASLVANALDGRAQGFDALISAVRVCGRDQWNAEQQGTMAGAAMSIFLRDDSAGKLTAVGVPTREIDRWFSEQHAEFQTNTEVTDAEATRLIDRLHGQGFAMELLDANGTAIGTYLGALIILRRVEQGLPID